MIGCITMAKCYSFISPFTKSRSKDWSLFLVWSLESVANNSQYEIQRTVSVSAINRLKNLNKCIRDKAKAVSAAKSTVWILLRKREHTSEINTKRPGRSKKTTVVKNRRILSFTTVGQIKTLQDWGVCGRMFSLPGRDNFRPFSWYTQACEDSLFLMGSKGLVLIGGVGGIQF